MKPCWHTAGLTESGAKLADRILEAMIGLVANAGPGVTEVVLREAIFRVEVLPIQSKAYQIKYLKENE